MEQSIPLLEEFGSSEQTSTNVTIDIEKKVDPEIPRWRKVCSTLKNVLPRYLQLHGLQYDHENLHSTAWLDSLRGYAACAVFFGHMYGFPSEGFASLPIIRLYSAGTGMVDLFFVISGYVLSFKMLQHMRNHQATRLIDCLASSTFRRYLRLYIPTALATFFTAIMTYAGWCQPGLRKDTIIQQFLHWASDTAYASNPFANVAGWWYPGVYRTAYLDQMWTIPVEFRGSIILFGFLAACAKLATRSRIALCCFTIFIAFYYQALYVACFLGGMLVVDLSMSWTPYEKAQQLSLPQSENGMEAAKQSRAKSITWQAGFVLIFIIGLVFLSQPQILSGELPFPYQYLILLIPSSYKDGAEHFWLSIGAILTVGALEYSPMLQKPLKWNISLYLGELSFGIYAMHNTLVWVLYLGWLAPWKDSTYPESRWPYIPISIFMSFVVLWAADYFTRIDKRIVAFGRWLQVSLFEKW
ncbi:hypothetical protein B0A52_06568 [Exophiala mesophila]|uniref:Acyltransferase 3 domain-containing protein n=1 Tax=Exophiala mesophila TaxID=212818 RepID=A0A438N1G7_EXOME|nr:hypothetical protein B0A52_06568 [Exophiala mesophila]